MTEENQKRTEDIVGELADALVLDLLKKIKSGTATAAELGVAKDYLKSSGIRLVLKGQGDKVIQLRPLPSFDDDSAPGLTIAEG